jgi:hypothetical protein
MPLPISQAKFGPSDSYYEHEDNVYCHYHYSTRFANKCAGCNTAILKQFVEVNRNMKEDCYHPECESVVFYEVLRLIISKRLSLP